ncbi:MAG: malonate decarboxylase acyl carrier protein [Burkholderiales bacterium]|nr:malonate decarboxylase acyl carrier protein [Burkholderiales bacterium]
MSTAPPGLETLDFEFAGSKAAGTFAPILAGVVGSGNLEVLLEPAAHAACRFRVQTSARGFGPIWEAVLRDFHRRHDFAGLSVSINDMGATPAVVGLRLAQAAAALPASPGARP